MGVFLSANKPKYIKFKDHAYVLNLEKFRQVCTPKTSELGTREYEISQVYEAEENGDFSLQSKVEHETKGVGNPQNDMIVYDVVKMMVLSILENDKPEEDFEYDFGTIFAINTLLYWGVLEEV